MNGLVTSKVWQSMDSLYNKAEASVQNTASDLWDFYNEVATSALGHTYGDRMEYYAAVGERYNVSTSTVRVWVREGKRDKDEFLTNGKLSSIAWKEKKKLEAELQETDDSAALESAVADLIDDGEPLQPMPLDTLIDDADMDVVNEVLDAPARHSFDSFNEELEGWRSLGFDTPAAARLEITKLRERLEEAKKAAITREDYETIEQFATKNCTDISALAKIHGTLRKIEALVK